MLALIMRTPIRSLPVSASPLVRLTAAFVRSFSRVVIMCCFILFRSPLYSTVGNRAPPLQALAWPQNKNRHYWMPKTLTDSGFFGKVALILQGMASGHNGVKDSFSGTRRPIPGALIGQKTAIEMALLCHRFGGARESRPRHFIERDREVSCHEHAAKEGMRHAPRPGAIALFFGLIPLENCIRMKKTRILIQSA